MPQPRAPNRPRGKARGPRVTKFLLVLWQDCPEPCADVIHVNRITSDATNLAPGMDVTVSWTKDTSKRGKVVVLGAERSLKKLRLDSNGNVSTTATGLLGRRECELRQTIRHRRGVVQSAADEAMLASVNADNSQTAATTESAPFKPDELKAYLNGLPSSPTLEEVQLVVQRLPCLAAHSGHDVQLVRGVPVYINTYVLATLHRLHGKRPGAYMAAIFRELVPPQVQRLPYLTAVGKGSTKVGLPKLVVKALTVYIDNRGQGSYQPANGFPNAINAIISYERDCCRKPAEENALNLLVDPPSSLSQIISPRTSALTVVQLRGGPTSCAEPSDTSRHPQAPEGEITQVPTATPAESTSQQNLTETAHKSAERLNEENSPDQPPYDVLNSTNFLSYVSL